MLILSINHLRKIKILNANKTRKKLIEIMSFTKNKLTELELFLYEKCRENPDLLATIISEYVWSLDHIKLSELEDFITNNFGED
jgi:hypothetical protein